MIPKIEMLDERIAPTPIGIGEVPTELPPIIQLPGPSPEALLDKAGNDAIIEYAEAEYRETLAKLNAQLRLIQTMEDETWWDALDRAIKSLIDAHVPMYPTIP